MACAAFALLVSTAAASAAEEGTTGTPEAPAAEEAKPTGFWERDTLTGDWGGVRTRLADAGIALGATENSEVLGNVSGGVRRGFDYMGRTEADLDLDLEKLLGWPAALIHVSGFQIHGRGLAANNLGGNFLGPSNIEAVRTTRLFDAYLQQGFLDDQLSVRAGQIALDEEFITSQYAGTFINSTFGWPGAMAADLPSGGPAYPLATPGVRVKYAPTKSFAWQTALTSGDPAVRGSNPNPQLRDRYGTSFNLNDDALLISEIDYTVSGGGEGGALPAVYKLGGWYHTGRFADERFDQSGRSLADPASVGEPRSHLHNYAVYAVVDQMLAPKAGTEDQGLATFLRLAGLPADRNAISLYGDAGLTYKGPFEGRESDVVGLAFSIAKVSHSLSQLDRDFDDFNQVSRPVRNYEAAVELTYQYVMAPWWTLQPDFQYIIHPAGNSASPAVAQTVSAPAIGNAAIIGARTTVKF